MIDMIVAASPYLIVGSICLLFGAGLGYYTACADHERKAHERAD